MKDFRGVEIRDGDHVVIISNQALVEREVAKVTKSCSWVHVPRGGNPRARSFSVISAPSRVVVLLRLDGSFPEMPVA